VLELRNVTAGYDGHVVVRDVDLCVPDGSVVALLGPNGAGKTTLLRAVAGLIPITAGAIRLDGRDVTGWPSHRRAQAGLCLVPEP
jgi:branched-chain amino acid transport system ATP-binding protein